MNRLIFSCHFILFCVFCFSQNKALYLDPDKAIGIKAMNLFSEIKIIPLETTKANSVINATNLLITPHHYIIVNKESGKIFIFSKDGKFLHKFKKSKYKLRSVQYLYNKNAIFFSSFNKNFTIPLFKAQQIIQNPGSRDFSRYVNLDLLYLDKNEAYRTEHLPVPKYAIQDIYYLNGKYIFRITQRNKFVKDTILYHMNFLDGSKISKSYFPFLNVAKLATDYDNIGYNIQPTLNDSVFYVQKEYDNTIYKLVNDSLEVAYKFVFPTAQTMPAEFNTTAFKNNIDYTSYKNKHSKAVRSFSSILDMEDFLFFETNNNSWESKDYVFNKTSSMLYDLSKINTDSSVHYLPAKIFSQLDNYDEDYVYTFLTSEELLKEKAGILARYKEGIPPQVSKVFEGLTKFSNPVIIQLKLKSGNTVK